MRAGLVFKNLAPSLLIAFHLGVIITVPNQEFWMQDWPLKNFVLGYANSIGVNNSWRLFSPEPGPPLYLSYDAIRADGSKESGYFPELADPFRFREHYDRRMTAMRYILVKPEAFAQSVAPYLCRKHPQAASISGGVMMIKRPSLQDVAERGRPLNALEDREMKPVPTYLCSAGDRLNEGDSK